MTTLNLRTEEGRNNALEQLSHLTRHKFDEAGIKLHQDTTLEIWEDSICFTVIASPERAAKGFSKEFGSELCFYCKTKEGFELSNKINHGTSGAYSPCDKGATITTITASLLLMNWDKACEIVNEACEKYRDLKEAIRKANK